MKFKTLTRSICKRKSVCLMAMAVLVAGCATAPEPKPVDLMGLESLREMGGEAAGPWTPLDGGVTNLVAEGTEIAEGQVRDGTGVSIGLLRGFKARNLSIEANVNYSGGGAPALVFRVQEHDGEITGMYAVSLFASGVNVWRFSDGRWMLLMTQAVALQPRVTHTLRADVEGDRIRVYADGEPMSEVRDDGLSDAGRAGIRALEGPCKFSNLRVTKR